MEASQEMKSFARCKLVLLGVGACLFATACEDPKDPQTWIDKLRDREHATQAVRKLRELGDPVAIKPLCDLFNDFPSPTILKAIISFKNKKAVPCLIKALDFTEAQYSNATLAASALADLGAKEAVPALIKVLKRKLSIKSRANKAKVAAIQALARLGDKRAVDPLVDVADTRPERQDFYLNKQAVIALGKIGDPRAVPVLIRALFLSSTLQGDAFPMAEVALVRIGEPAVQPLLDAMAGKDEALNKMAKDLSFKPGIVLNKTAIVLGDLMAKPAVDPLLQQLAKADVVNETKIAGVIEALGKIGDAKAVGPLIKLLQNGKAHYKLRVQTCAALTLLGDKRAVPVLLEIAEKGFIQGGYWNLREAGVMAYSRVVGSGAPKGIRVIKAILAKKDIQKYKQTEGVFKEALERAKVALECKDDAACYGQKIIDKSLSLAQREKAGIMIGILPDGRKGLDGLVKALPNREPILRQYFLEAAKRIGTQKDKAMIDTLAKLAAKDSKRKVKFLGADLARFDKIALAVVKRKAQP